MFITGFRQRGSKTSTNTGWFDELSDIEPSIEPIIPQNSFLDDTDSIPDLEQVPEMTEIPSFLGSEYQARQCSRVTRSGNVRYHPFI